MLNSASIKTQRSNFNLRHLVGKKSKLLFLVKKGEEQIAYNKVLWYNRLTHMWNSLPKYKIYTYFFFILNFNPSKSLPTVDLRNISSLCPTVPSDKAVFPRHTSPGPPAPNLGFLGSASYYQVTKGSH